MKYVKIATTIAALVMLFAIPNLWWSVLVYISGDIANDLFNKKQ